MRTKKAREKTPRLLQGLAGFLQKKRWAWLSPGTKSIRAWKTKEGGEGGADEAAQQQLQRPLEAASLFPYAGWLKLKEEHRDVEDFMEAIFLLASCRLLLCLYTTSFFSLRKEIPSLALE